MRERDKKHKTSKKKKTIPSFTSQLHTATIALPGRPHDQSPTQRCIVWHLDVAPVQGQLIEKNVKKKASLSSANFYLRITFDKAKVLHHCSFCWQPKAKENESHAVRDEPRPVAQTHGCPERCILCVFSCVFFFF